jgi:hypothetical protein
MYALNGEPLGRGHAGYLKLLERMWQMPIGSTLKVQFQPLDATGCGPGYSVPLSGENSDFANLSQERHIKLIFPSGSGWV